MVVAGVICTSTKWPFEKRLLEIASGLRDLIREHAPEFGAVEEVFHAVDPLRIAWVSLGSLRFTGHLREIVRARFPRSRIPNGEFVPGNHGKLRYFRPIREEMYARMREWIHRAAPNVFVYLCMENRAAWENSFEVVPRNTEDLSDQMDTLVRISS